jgi:hypothetical protein
MKISIKSIEQMPKDSLIKLLENEIDRNSVLNKNINNKFNLTDIPLTKYLTSVGKRHLDNIFNGNIGDGKKINCKNIAKQINEPPCVVRLYYIEKHGSNAISKFNKDEDYIYYKDRYMMFSGCGYKRGQYIMAKELGVDMKTISKFLVHHHDRNRMNDNLWNLLLMYDKEHHGYIHADNHVCWDDFIDLAERFLKRKFRMYFGMNKAGRLSNESYERMVNERDEYIELFNKLYRKIRELEFLNKFPDPNTKFVMILMK